MELNLELYDPLGVKMCTTQIEAPLNIYEGEGAPRSQNYYILHIGNNKVRINKDGSLKLEQ